MKTLLKNMLRKQKYYLVFPALFSSIFLTIGCQAVVETGKGVASKVGVTALVHQMAGEKKFFTGPVELGGYGTGQGKFDTLSDITFGPKGSAYGDTLFVLDGGEIDHNKKKGNFLVQLFDPTSGAFKSQFSVYEDSLADKNAPARIAVDPQGNVYVTQPHAGLVIKYNSQGQRLATITVPNAYAIAWTPSRGIVVVPQVSSRGKGAASKAGTLYFIDVNSNSVTTVSLSTPIYEAYRIATVPDGTFYIAAAVNSLYQFSADGKLLDTLGSGTRLRAEDGSEPHFTVAVDSASNIYSTTWGNPGYILRFSADKTKVYRRADSFRFGDPWITHGAYTPLAIDSQDHLWIGLTNIIPQSSLNYTKHHFSPAVLRTPDDYMAEKTNGVITTSTLGLGVNPVLTTDLPYNIGYSFDPVPVHLNFAAAHREVNTFKIEWQARDSNGTVLQTGTSDAVLSDEKAGIENLSFVPKRFGVYDVGVQVYEKRSDGSKGADLAKLAIHIGITPPFKNLPQLSAGESPGGWDDAPRLAFIGHTLFRTRINKLDDLEKAVSQAEKYHLILVAQFEGQKDVTDDKVTEAVTRFKGRVKYWSIINEPDISLPGSGVNAHIQDYVTILRRVAPLIRRIDPEAKILAPSFVSMDPDHIKSFYDMLGPGGASLFDIFSIHDYQGGESIDPEYWCATLKSVRGVMAQYGDAKKEIWQTERAIGAVRGNTYDGMVQAVRIALHRNVLDSQGIPSEHNNYYYMNNSGYVTVPSFIWSISGPHPAALALRTRAAILGNRKYIGNLQFGASGNLLLLGLRHQGEDRTQVVTLQTLGLEHFPVTLTVKGASQIQVTDAWGNVSAIPVSNGTATIDAGLMPVYISLAAGEEVSPPNINYGTNLVAGSKAVWSAGESKGSPPIATITNGIMENTQVVHATTTKPWRGELVSDPNLVTEIDQSQKSAWYLEIPLSGIQKVNRILLFPARADNARSTLLDYDIEYRKAGQWIPLTSARSHMSPSVVEATPLASVSAFYADQNTYMDSFPTIQTDRLRIVVRRTTYGFLPDLTAVKFGWHATNPSVFQPTLDMREVMVFGPSR